LPVPDMGQGMLDRDGFTQLRAAVRVLLPLAQLGQQRLVGMATLRPRTTGLISRASW
jgi:hypothetical protein